MPPNFTLTLARSLYWREPPETRAQQVAVPGFSWATRTACCLLDKVMM